jgi:hypothetical protein
MARSKTYPWIRWDGGHTLICQRCGAVYSYTLPAPVPIVIAICNVWSKLHRFCREP